MRNFPGAHARSSVAASDAEFTFTIFRLMKRKQAIADRIRRTLTGPMWHGDAIRSLLTGVTPAQAVARPVKGAHSIWELVLHITAWANIVRERLSMREQPAPTDAQDWPGVASTPDEKAWTAALARLMSSHEILATTVEKFEERALDSTVPAQSYSVAEMLTGVVEHGTYHGGQIALLKRALADRTRAGRAPIGGIQSTDQSS